MKKKLCAIALLFTLICSTVILSSCGSVFVNMLGEETRAKYVYNKAMMSMYEKNFIISDVTQAYTTVFDGQTTNTKVRYRAIDDYSDESRYKCSFVLLENTGDAFADYEYYYNGQTLYEKSGELLLKQDMTEEELGEYVSANSSSTFANIDFFRDMIMTCDKIENGIFTIKLAPADETVLKEIYAGMKDTLGSSYQYMMLESFDGVYKVTEDYDMLSSSMTYVIKATDGTDTSYTLRSTVTYSFDSEGVTPPENSDKYIQTDGLLALAKAEAATNRFASADSGKCKMDYKSRISQGFDYSTSMKVNGDLIYYTDSDGKFIFDYNVKSSQDGLELPSSKISYDGEKLNVKSDSSTSEQTISEIEASQYVSSILLSDVYIDKSEYKTVMLGKSDNEKNTVLCASLDADYVTYMVSTVFGTDDFTVISIPESIKTFEFDEKGNITRYTMKISFNYKYESEDYHLSIDYVLTNEGLDETVSTAM